MAAGGPRGTSHCLVCNVSVTEGSDSRDIFQHSALAERLQPILQVALYEGSSYTRNLCLNCEIQVGMVEEYYKVLEKFRKNFAHTASFYGLELVPIQEAQKPAYQFIQAAQGQLSFSPPAPAPTQAPTHTQVQAAVNNGHWEEILFCLEPQGGPAAPQAVMVQTQNAMTSPVTLVQEQQQQQQQHEHEQSQQQQPQHQTHHPQQQPQQQIHQPQHHTHHQHQQQQQQQHQQTQVQTLEKNSIPRVPEFYVYKKNAPRHPLTDRQHVCAVCNKGFLNGTHLKQHMRSHTGERPYKCPECPAAFSMQCNLKRHVLLHTGERPYSCNQCGSRYKQLAHLKRHMRTHDGSKPFECEHCGKRFRFEHDFKEHMRLHTGEGPYRCQLCNSAFVRQRSYKEHLKVHSDERPHKCTVCPANYKRRSELVIHMRRHSGERPFGCEVCGKAFVTSSKLSIHKALHKDVRPFECSTCLAKFKQKNNLKAHERRHEEEQKALGLVEMEIGEETLRKTIIDEIKNKKIKKKKRKRKSVMVDSSTCTSDNVRYVEEDTQGAQLHTEGPALMRIHNSANVLTNEIRLQQVDAGSEHHYEVIVMDDQHQDTVHQLTSVVEEHDSVATILVREVGEEASSLLSAENIVEQDRHAQSINMNGADIGTDCTTTR